MLVTTNERTTPSARGDIPTAEKRDKHNNTDEFTDVTSRLLSYGLFSFHLRKLFHRIESIVAGIKYR